MQPFLTSSFVRLLFLRLTPSTTGSFPLHGSLHTARTGQSGACYGVAQDSALLPAPASGSPAACQPATTPRPTMMYSAARICESNGWSRSSRGRWQLGGAEQGRRVSEGGLPPPFAVLPSTFTCYVRVQGRRQGSSLAVPRRTASVSAFEMAVFIAALR